MKQALENELGTGIDWFLEPLWVNGNLAVEQFYGKNCMIDHVSYCRMTSICDDGIIEHFDIDGNHWVYYTKSTKNEK